MVTQKRLTTFAMTGATWVTWMLVGLSEGGVAVALERAFYLIVGTTPVRKLRADFVARLRRGGAPANDVSAGAVHPQGVTAERLSPLVTATVRIRRTPVRDLLRSAPARSAAPVREEMR